MLQKHIYRRKPYYSVQKLYHLCLRSKCSKMCLEILNTLEDGTVNGKSVRTVSHNFPDFLEFNEIEN